MSLPCRCEHFSRLNRLLHVHVRPVVELTKRFGEGRELAPRESTHTLVRRTAVCLTVSVRLLGLLLLLILMILVYVL